MVDRRLVELLTVSLDASLRTDRWEELLDKLVDYLGLISGVIIVSDPRHERRITPFQSRFIREDARDMLQRFLAHEDVDDAPAYKALQSLPLNNLYSEPEIFGCADWDGLPASAFRDFQRDAFDINYRFVMPLNNFVSCADLLTLHSARDLKADGRGQIDGLELIAPILGKALRLHRIFSALQAQFSAMLLALDRLRLGTLLLMEDCTVIHSNETAQAILQAKDGLRLDLAKRLEASDSRTCQQLREAVSEVNQTAALNGLTADRSCAIARPSGKPDYLMTVGPLVDSVGELEHGLACAIAFIADPAEMTPISTAGLDEVGRLTPAESEVCQYLVNGLSLSDIAEQRGVTRETVKSQASGIMSKLNCHSRLDLVRLAAMTRLPIDSGSRSRSR